MNLPKRKNEIIITPLEQDGGGTSMFHIVADGPLVMRLQDWQGKTPDGGGIRTILLNSHGATLQINLFYDAQEVYAYLTELLTGWADEMRLERFQDATADNDQK